MKNPQQRTKRELTESQQSLELGVSLLQVLDAVVQAHLAVLALVVRLERRQSALFQPPEREYHVRAQLRVDVLGQVLAGLGPVLRPVRVIANDL